MSELRQILDLWKRARAAGEEVCVATVVAVEGSAYRRPGARMVLTQSGQRAGTISGGCLEAEVAKKAWWLTEQGPSLQRYSSFFDDDGDMPYGLGCGGTVIVLLERGEPAAQTLEALRRSVEERSRSVIVTSTNAETHSGMSSPGTKLILNQAGEAVFARGENPELMVLARATVEAGLSRQTGEVFVEAVTPPPSLILFGAGDDAQPLVEFAATLGWHVTVADGRSHLVRRERFPRAACVVTPEAALAAAGPADAAVLMTHSYEQDNQVLQALLAREMKYIGVLGPRRRTERLVGEIAPRLGLAVDDCLARLHTPVGLDLGGHSPASIALAIAAELQAVFAGRAAQKLSAVRLIHA